MRHGISKVAYDRVLGLYGFLHFLANFVDSILVEARPLDELPELDIFALELGLPDGEDLVKHLILDVGFAAQLLDAELKLGDHIVLFLLDAVKLLFKVNAILLYLLVFCSQDLKARFRISEAHLVFAKCLQLPL